jgi:hypothetical protein
MGTGLTQKPTVSFDSETDESDPEIAALIETATLDGLISSIEQKCFAVMSAAEMPTYHGWYQLFKGGSWRAPKPPFGGTTMTRDLWSIAKARGHQPDSEIGFAARILSDITWLREHQRAGDHDRAALFHGYIMTKMAEQRIKVAQERTWETGRKQRDYLGALRDDHNKDRHDIRAVEWSTWNSKAAEVWAASPKLSVSAVARVVKSQLKLSDSERTIRERLKKPGEAG